VDAEPDTINSYRQPIFHGYAIGCERCHGPGALHAQARENFREVEEPDLTIVHPGRLPAFLRESVCEQCHLGGQQRVARAGRSANDFRPGLPWESFVRVFVTPPDAAQGNRVTGHVEQMRASRCFQRSDGRLGCTSCHDPHVLPGREERETYYRDRCLACHETQGCTVPLTRRRETTRADDCTVCHMAAEDSNIRHVALTDHRILRRREVRTNANAGPPALPAARLLVPFGRDAVDRNDPELARDWAVALMSEARERPEDFRTEASRLCLPLLIRAVRDHPDDLPAGECLALAWAWQGQLEQALAESETVLARAPRREVVLHDAGVTAQRMGRFDLSLDYWRRALAVNPWSSRYRFEVAQRLAHSGDQETAVAEFKRVLARNGGHVNSRFLLMNYYLQNGMRPQARTELEAILALHPPNADAFRREYGELLR
jgi:Flp pilus assembly protein TadD